MADVWNCEHQLTAEGHVEAGFGFATTLQCLGLDRDGAERVSSRIAMRLKGATHAEALLEHPEPRGTP